MKLILILLFVLWSGVAYGAGVPVAITQLASNTTTSAMIVRGLAFPNGTNSYYWFVSGFAPSVMTTTSGVISIGSGTTTQSVNTTLSGLLAGTRYYYALTVSNVFGISTGATENAVTTQVTYDFTGTGYQNIDITRPFGSEPGSVWDDAIRQFKAAAVSANGQTHDIYGNLLPNIVQTTNIADGAVTAAKLAAGVAASFTGGVVNAVITNALIYLGGTEIDSVDWQLNGQVDKIVGTSSFSSNTFRKVKVDAWVLLANNSSSSRDFIIRLKAGGVVQKEFIVQYLHDTIDGQEYSMISTGGQNSATTVEIAVSGGANTSSQTATLKYLRMWGIP